MFQATFYITRPVKCFSLLRPYWQLSRIDDLHKIDLANILNVYFLSIAWKVSKYGVFSGPYFAALGLNTERYSVFSSNARKYESEKIPYLDTFYAEFLYIYGKKIDNKVHKKDVMYLMKWKLYQIHSCVLEQRFYL